MKLGYFCYFLLALAAVGSLLLPYSIAMWFLLANVLTWLIYGIDKLAARKAWSRIPESTLLAFGLLGGWPGSSVFATKPRSSHSEHISLLASC